MVASSRAFFVGDLVEALYRGNSGIIFKVTRVETNHRGHQVCTLAPYRAPNGDLVTKRHGYRPRRLGAGWLRAWSSTSGNTAPDGVKK